MKYLNNSKDVEARRIHYNPSPSLEKTSYIKESIYHITCTFNFQVEYYKHVYLSKVWKTITLGIENPPSIYIVAS